jgi:hypothetical protein
MPGWVACDGEDLVVRDHDFHARTIGIDVVDRQGIKPSLVALQPW